MAAIAAFSRTSQLRRKPRPIFKNIVAHQSGIEQLGQQTGISRRHLISDAKFEIPITPQRR